MPAQCSRQPSFAWLWLEHSVRTLANLSGLRRFVVQIRHVRTDRPGRTMTAATARMLLRPKDGGRACNATLWSSRYNCTTAKLHYRSRESRGKFGRLGLFPAGVSPRFCRFVGHKRAYRVPVFSRALASHDGGFDWDRSWFQRDYLELNYAVEKRSLSRHFALTIDYTRKRRRKMLDATYRLLF